MGSISDGVFRCIVYNQAPGLTTLVAVGIVAAVVVIFALQVLGTVRKLASEVKLMQEALQITVRESLSTNKLPQLNV